MGFLLPSTPPAISIARLEITSFAFMFVCVPLRVCQRPDSLGQPPFSRFQTRESAQAASCRDQYRNESANAPSALRNTDRREHQFSPCCPIQLESARPVQSRLSRWNVLLSHRP